MDAEDKKRAALEALAKFGELQREAEAEYEASCNKFWNDLSYDDQLKAFYSVCKRIYEGDIKQRGSYRYVLYDVFNFEPDAYGIGMNCGYMAIHNAIFDGIEFGDEDDKI